MAEADVPSLPVHLTKRIRLACDKCHSQKLKCRKLPGSGQCARCAKAQSRCVFSPANRGFRSNPEAERVPQGSENGVGVRETSSSSEEDMENSSPEVVQAGSSNETNTENGFIDIVDIRNDAESDALAQFEAWNPNDTPMYLPDMNDFDIENLDFSLAEDLSQRNANFPPFHVERNLGNNPLNNQPTEPASTITPFVAAGLYIQRLSNLSVNLYEHAATIPPFGYDPRDEHEQDTTNYCKPDGSDFPIDKTFTYTQQLLDIMDELFPRSPVSSPFHGVFNNISNLDKQVQSKHLTLDPATMLLVLSCYLRLVDIYEMLFGYLEVCIKKFPYCLALPEQKQVVHVVRVGSFNAESAMTASMAILHIFFGLSRQLFDRMSGVASVMGYSDGREEFVSKTSHAEITETSFRSAERRTREATQKFNQVRMDLFQLGIL